MNKKAIRKIVIEWLNSDDAKDLIQDHILTDVFFKGLSLKDGERLNEVIYNLRIR